MTYVCRSDDIFFVFRVRFAVRRAGSIARVESVESVALCDDRYRSSLRGRSTRAPDDDAVDARRPRRRCGNDDHRRRRMDADALERGESLALEVRAPYADALVTGRKRIDVRAYVVDAAIGARVWIVETRGGTPGRSVLANAWSSEEIGTSACRDGGDAAVVGWVSFDGVVEYESKERFERDASDHLVDEESVYAFRPGTPCFGWRVSRRGVAARRLTSLRRLHRSVFAIRLDDDEHAHGNE